MYLHFYLEDHPIDLLCREILEDSMLNFLLPNRFDFLICNRLLNRSHKILQCVQFILQISFLLRLRRNFVIFVRNRLRKDTIWTDLNLDNLDSVTQLLGG